MTIAPESTTIFSAALLRRALDAAENDYDGRTWGQYDRSYSYLSSDRLSGLWLRVTARGIVASVLTYRLVDGRRHGRQPVLASRVSGIVRTDSAEWARAVTLLESQPRGGGDGHGS